MNPSLEPTSAGGSPKSHTVPHHVKPVTPDLADSARMCSSREALVRLPTIRVTYRPCVLCFVHARAQSCGAPASRLNNDMVASQRQDCRLVIVEDLSQVGFGTPTEK